MISIMMLLIAAPALAMQQARVQCGRTATTRVPPIVMLRNIDSCEAVILTLDVAMDAATGHTRRGVERLIGECKKEGALVALLVPGDGASPSPSDDVLRTMAAHGTMCWPFKGTEPQTSELSELRRALKVEEPEGFGGSDGFGQAPGMAYGREPIAARCVVLVTSLAETAAAIGAGMRAVGLPATEGDWVDEALDGVADVCLDAVGEDGDTWALRLIHGVLQDPDLPFHQKTCDAWKDIGEPSDRRAVSVGASEGIVDHDVHDGGESLHECGRCHRFEPQVT